MKPSLATRAMKTLFQVDFVAVEMHDGKVSLLWNVGSGTTRLEFPGTDISNNRWTRINATL